MMVFLNNHNLKYFVIFLCIFINIIPFIHSQVWEMYKNLRRVVSSLPPPREVCRRSTGRLCDNSAPALQKYDCYNRGCCYNSLDGACYYPQPMPGLAVCIEGCSHVYIEGGGRTRIWNGPLHYQNNERVTIEVYGPCEISIDYLQVERPDLCKYDFLRILGKRVCLATSEPYNMPMGKTFIAWRSDTQRTDVGYSLHIGLSSSSSLSEIDEASSQPEEIQVKNREGEEEFIEVKSTVSTTKKLFHSEKQILKTFVTTFMEETLPVSTIPLLPDIDNIKVVHNRTQFSPFETKPQRNVMAPPLQPRSIRSTGIFMVVIGISCIVAITLLGGLIFWWRRSSSSSLRTSNEIANFAAAYQYHIDSRSSPSIHNPNILPGNQVSCPAEAYRRAAY